jgi:beta-lactamase regulating signal transducer with metallopeptidase domain
MAFSTTTLSLTRPKEPAKEYASNIWQYNVGLAAAAAGLMLLMAFFIISAVVAGWVSDITDPGETNLASLAGRITAYDSWLFPVATASIGLIKVGIALVLWGIVRRLWIRVESVKESLPMLVKRGGVS